MCADLGFQIGDDPSSRGIKVVTLTLSDRAAAA